MQQNSSTMMQQQPGMMMQQPGMMAMQPGVSTNYNLTPDQMNYQNAYGQPGMMMHQHGMVVQPGMMPMQPGTVAVGLPVNAIIMPFQTEDPNLKCHFDGCF